MAEQPNNLEMFDVLASIRRLVSEERKAAPTRIEPVPPQPPRAGGDDAGPAAGGEAAEPVQGDSAPDAAPSQPRYSGLPQESRFVLTAALRVGDEGAATDMQQAWDDDARDDQRPATDLGGGSSAALSATAEIDEIDRRTASLEETIAELEAAVADIGSEFEPDGGESDDLVTELFPDPVGQAADGAYPATSDMPASRGGFHGIMAGFETMLPPDEVLDAPVTGDALIPPMGFSRPAAAGGQSSASPFGRAWSVSDKEAHGQPADAQPAPDPTGATNATFTHAAPLLSDKPMAEEPLGHDADPAHGDVPVAGDAPQSASETAPDAWGHAPLGTAEIDVDLSDPAPTAAEGNDDPAPWGAVGMTGAEGPEADPDGRDLAEEARAGEASATHALGEESVAGHAEGAEESPDESPDERHDEGRSEPAHPGPRLGRPQIVRSQTPGAESADDDRDLAGGAGHDDLSDEDEPDLFNPLASADMDMDAMRDIVAELVREELRGVLGERITRNLRALVRNEIRKALAEGGPARG